SGGRTRKSGQLLFHGKMANSNVWWGYRAVCSFSLNLLELHLCPAEGLVGWVWPVVAGWQGAWSVLHGGGQVSILEAFPPLRWLGRGFKRWPFAFLAFPWPFELPTTPFPQAFPCS